MHAFLMLLVLIQLKHFVFDFLWQPKWMYANKGTLMHPGGIVHAGVHAVASFFVFFWWANHYDLYVAMPDVLFACAVEFVAHYVIDFAKMNVGRAMGWGPTTHDNFWRLLGLDQLLHQLTYLWMIWVICAYAL